jgi:ATP-dependent DNA ligase
MRAALEDATRTLIEHGQQTSCGYRERRMRKSLRPMLTRAGAIPIGSDWAFEVKWDGFRTIVSTEDGFVCASRNNAGHDLAPSGFLARIRRDLARLATD